MNYISFLKGLIDINPLSFETGIPLSTLYKYQSGTYRPSAERLEGLKQTYARIQATRLQAAGLPYTEAVRLSTSSRTAINGFIRDTRKAIKNVADMANERRLSEGKDALSDSVYTKAFSESDHTAEELWDY